VTAWGFVPRPATAAPVSPPAPDERGQSARVLDAATTWLRAHPEIVQIASVDLGLGSWRYRRVVTSAGSTLCVEDGDPGEPPSHRTCWTDPRPVAAVSTWGFSWPARKPTSDDDDRYQYDHVRGFIALGPFDGKDEVWAVRFPEAERVLVGHGPHTDTPDDRMPAWFPVPLRGTAKRMALPTRGWEPLPITSAPELGALASVDVRLLSSGGPSADVTVLELGAGVGTAICARRNGAWTCAPPTFVEYEGEFHVAGHDAAQSVPSRDGAPWLLVQRSTIENGGNGEGSGAGGNQFLEIYREAAGTLRPLGALVLGRMEWTTKRRQGHYWRAINRYAHTYTVTGPDCLRIARAIEHQGWADGSFVTAAPPGTHRTPARLPSARVPDAIPFAGIPTVHKGYQDPNRDLEAEGSGRLILRDLSGPWCLDGDRLVRVTEPSRVPARRDAHR
jgi:hypothetical protein